MSLEENKTIVRRFFEVENKKDLALLDELMALDYVDAPNTPFEIRGLESVKQYYANVYRGFPDFHVAIEDIITEGDKVWVLGKLTGTHTGEWEFLGITFAPTGKKLTWTAVNIFRIVDGKIVERKSVRDVLNFLKQIGAIEYTEKGKKLFPEDVT